MSHLLDLDPQITGSAQTNLDARIRKLNSVMGITGDQWNGDKRFSHTSGFNNNLAGWSTANLTTLLHVIDQINFGDGNFTANTLPDATELVTVPMNGNPVTFDNVLDFVVTHQPGGSFYTQADTFTIAPVTSGTPGTISLQGATNTTQVRCHENATQDVVFQLPATQQEGLIHSDALGRTANSELSFTNHSVTGESIVGTLTGNTSHTFRRIRSVGATIDVTTDGDGAINLEAITGGRNRGQFAAAIGATVVWPIITDGTILVGSAFVDFDEFTISVTADTGGDTFDFDDTISPPVTVKSGDKIVLLDSASPTLTTSWTVVAGQTAATDSNLMTENLTNTTNDRLHDGGAFSFGLTNVNLFTISAVTFDLIASGASALAIDTNQQLKLAGYDSGALDGTQVRTLGLNATNDVVTFNPAALPTSWIQHVLFVTDDIPPNTIIKLDGSTANTTLSKDGSLDWTNWVDQDALADDPYTRCLLDGVAASFDLTTDAHNVCVKNGTDGVLFTSWLQSGTVISLRIPVYG